MNETGNILHMKTAAERARENRAWVRAKLWEHEPEYAQTLAILARKVEESWKYDSPCIPRQVQDLRERTSGKRDAPNPGRVHLQRRDTWVPAI